MSMSDNAMRSLTIEELEMVAGAVHVVEFAIGPAKFQFDIIHDAYAFWNGSDKVGGSEKD